jgi:aminoglycoside/choline kinase family phosphotransferase
VSDAEASANEAQADGAGRTVVEEYLADRGRSAAQATALSGDASTRRYFRVVDDGSSFVLALYPEPFEPGKLSFLGMRELLDGYELAVPATVDVDGARGIVLQEDLGDHTLQETLKDVDAAGHEALYREAIDDIATLQRKSAEGPQSADCFEIAFDIEKLSWELHYFLKHFVEGYRGCELTVEDRSTLSEAFHQLSQEIASWPRTLCHRDFHSRNLMLHRERLFWIDFQDARMGPATYDLASLLRDAYVDVPEEMSAALAERFRQRAVPGESREQFRRRFELMAVQRTLKALGTFGYMATVRDNPVYLPYMPRTLAHARHVLSRYPELERLWRTLGDRIEELA